MRIRQPITTQWRRPPAAKRGDRAKWAGSGLLAIAIIAGCGDSSESSGAPIQFDQDPIQFDERDSAGIRITETSPAVLEVALPWVVFEEPELELGSDDGEVSQEFDRIRAMTVVRNGSLVVVNASGHELRWFDGTGTYLFTVGREGRGPGEFSVPRLVRQFDGDSILVADRTRRLTWIAPDGSGHRVQSVAPGGMELMTGAALAAQGERVLFRSGTTICPRGEFCQPDGLFRWLDLAEATSDTIAIMKFGMISTLELGELPYLLESPFHSVGANAMGPGGPVLEGASGYELLQFDDRGQLVRIHRIAAPPQEAGEDAVEQVLRRWTDAGEDPGPWRRVYGGVDLPDALPAFQSIIVDRVGWLWAERFRLVPHDPPIWVVFDPEGKARGVIELPSGLEVHEIGKDYVLGRATDGMGREIVRRHALERND